MEVGGLWAFLKQPGCIFSFFVCPSREGTKQGISFPESQSNSGGSKVAAVGVDPRPLKWAHSRSKRDPPAFKFIKSYSYKILQECSYVQHSYMRLLGISSEEDTVYIYISRMQVTCWLR